MDLTIENPWWFSGGLWQDRDLQRAKASLLSYDPRPFTLTEAETGAVFTLRGPRRVGKTVALKQLVARLIEERGIDPRAILWLNFDTLRTLRQMEELFLTIFQPQARDGYRFVFIDEVTSVLGWQKVIKKYRDNGLLEGRTLLLTGSSAYDLKAGAERMAGRRAGAESPDRILLPLGPTGFREQVKALGLSDEETCRRFLSVGGFPFRISGFLRAQTEGREWSHLADFQIFEDLIFYEFARRRLERSLASEVIARLSSVGAHAISYTAFAKQVSTKPDTARRYLDVLGDAYLLATISSYDTARSRVASKKDRKFVRIDPALGYLAESLHQGVANDEATRAEWAVGALLLKHFEARLFEGLTGPRNVFTWKSSSGNEVDYLVIDRSQKLMLPVEVKWQKEVAPSEHQTMEKAFGKGILVTPSLPYQRPKSTAVPLYALETRLADIDTPAN